MKRKMPLFIGLTSLILSGCLQRTIKVEIQGKVLKNELGDGSCSLKIDSGEIQFTVWSKEESDCKLKVGQIVKISRTLSE